MHKKSPMSSQTWEIFGAGYGRRVNEGVMPVEPGMSNSSPNCCIWIGSTPDCSKKKRGADGTSFFLEQDTGVEPAFTAWET